MKTNIDPDSVTDYQKAKSEREKLNDRIKSLQVNLAEAEKFLGAAKQELKEAKTAETSDSLITIKDVETVRKKTENAKDKVNNAQFVCDNLEKSINKAAGSMPGVQNREQAASRKIFRQHSEALLEEIKVLAGLQIDEFIVSLAIAYPESTPHPLPGQLGAILRQPERMNALRNTMREALLKN